MYESSPRIWQSLLLPLSCIEVEPSVWAIVIKGTKQNVLQSEGGQFVVFRCASEAKDSYDKIKKMREDYRKHGTLPIRVNL